MTGVIHAYIPGKLPMKFRMIPLGSLGEIHTEIRTLSDRRKC